MLAGSPERPQPPEAPPFCSLPWYTPAAYVRACHPHPRLDHQLSAGYLVASNKVAGVVQVHEHWSEDMQQQLLATWTTYLARTSTPLDFFGRVVWLLAASVVAVVSIGSAASTWIIGVLIGFLLLIVGIVTALSITRPEALMGSRPAFTPSEHAGPRPNHGR